MIYDEILSDWKFVISVTQFFEQDFDSVGLKTKRHWNSFTTEFFISVENVTAELKELGKVEKKDELAACIDLPLACHKCDFKSKNMPELKKHIATHS